MDILFEYINSVNQLLWSYILIALLVICALWFTIKTQFVQFRMFPEMLRSLASSTLKGGARDKHISSFQAFVISLASRIGTGNMAGVATAIVLGGPGAIFWLWLVAFLRPESALRESTFALSHKRRGKQYVSCGTCCHRQVCL